MASVASQLIQEVTAHAQSDSLEDAREICADGTYFPNNLRILYWSKPWSRNLREGHGLSIFENRMLSKKLGSKRDQLKRGWKRLRNEKHRDLYSTPDITSVQSQKHEMWS